MSSSDQGRSSYLDLLIATLSEHEKTMDRLIEKMEKLSRDLLKAHGRLDTKVINQKGGAKKKSPDIEDSGTITYMKIKINRPVDQITKILETLKE